MRDLTNLFIREMGPHVDKHVKKEELDDKHYTEVLIRYGNKSHEIRNHVLTLPSAREQGHLCSGDWVYEACRIAAVIYAEAIVEQQDFSTVGDHLYDREAFRTYIQYSTCPLPTDTLVGKLYEAIWLVSYTGCARSARQLPPKETRCGCDDFLGNMLLERCVFWCRHIRRPCG
jgi:hypothetical protein